MRADSRTPLPLVFTLFLFSGATSLVYQVVWLRQLILIFGSTLFASSAILSTFMAGLALGAFVGGRWLGKTSRPLRLYGILEIAIGVYALIVPFLFGLLSPIYRSLWEAGLSESFELLSLAKFVGIGCVLLPPTILMGATLPVLARQVADDERRIGGKVGGLYAINTFGAVLGTFFAGFVAIPQFGVLTTIWVTAAANGLVGIAAILGSQSRPALEPPTSGVDTATSTRTPGWKMRLVLLAFAASGFAALTLEVAWTRVLALVIGSSVYAFSLMLLAFLVGLALGSAAFSSLLRRRPGLDPALLLAALLGSAGFLAYATSWAFQALPYLFATVFFQFQDPDGLQTLGPEQWFAVQFLLGLAIMFPATFCLGGIFPAVIQLHASSLAEVSGSVGTVYASNTVGTIVGAAVAGFVLIPRLGVQPTVLMVASLEVGLGLLIAFVVVPRSVTRRFLVIGALILALPITLFARPEWDLQLMNSGVYMNLFGGDYKKWEDFLGAVKQNNEVVYAEEGLTSSVFVADQPEYDNRYLSVNGKIEASTQSDMETQLMCSHLPLMFHENPKDVLVIGLASGISVGAVAAHPVDSIRVVEVERAMEPAARLFGEQNNFVLDDPRVTLSFNDARNELEFSPATYDVIISEPSNPWMTVAANLFTEDFFAMASTRLREGGVFSQWIQNYYLPTDDLLSVIAAFRKSFRYVMVFETFGGVDLLMMGSQHPIRLDLAELDDRMTELRVRMDLLRVDMRDPVDVVSLFRLGPPEVDELVAGAPRNTDDNARVEFSAPKAFGNYTTDENREHLNRFRADPLGYLAHPISDPAERDRLRLELAESLAERGNFDMALDEAGKVDGRSDLRSEADRLVERIEQSR